MVRYLLLICLVLNVQLVFKICAEADGLNSNSVTEIQPVIMNTVIAQNPSITSNPSQVTIQAIPDYITSTAKPMHTVESIQTSSIPTKADIATLNNTNDKTTFQSTDPKSGVFPIEKEGNLLYCKIKYITIGCIASYLYINSDIKKKYVNMNIYKSGSIIGCWNFN